MFQFIREDIRRLADPNQNRSLRSILAGLLSPGFQALAVYRFFNWCYRHSIPAQPFRYVVERAVEIMTGISIPARCNIGKGLRIHHFGGVIFHSTAELGDYCTVYHDVTIGDRGGSGSAARIGSHVLFGAGAKIIGEVTIGSNCKIGANAVVTKDMPPGTLAFGNPAQYRQMKDDDTLS